MFYIVKRLRYFVWVLLLIHADLLYEDALCEKRRLQKVSFYY